MTIFVSLLITAATFAFIVYPFFKRRLSAETMGTDSALKELDSKKDTTYSMLKELEFDYHSGILSEEDYRDLENRYKKKAVSILKELDETKEPSAGMDDAIEKEVRRLRRQKSIPDDEIEQQVRRLRQRPAASTPHNVAKANAASQPGKRQFCTHCGAKIQPADRFCPDCGTRLSGGKQA